MLLPIKGNIGRPPLLHVNLGNIAIGQLGIFHAFPNRFQLITQSAYCILFNYLYSPKTTSKLSILLQHRTLPFPMLQALLLVSLFSKVYFPRLVAPLAGITSGFIKALIQTLPLIVVYIYYVIDGEPIHLTWEFLLTPVLFVLIALMGLGCGLIISALTVRYRDLNNLVTFGLQLWMYSTPVIYPVSISGDRTLTAFLIGNPLQGIFTDFRYMLTGIGVMDWWGLLYSFLFTIVILFLGIIIFNRQERTFMDTI